LFEHQDVACAVLEFHPLTEAQRRALVRVLRDELSRTIDRQRLLGFARRWLYERRLLVPRERDLRVMIRKAIRSHESALAQSIQGSVEPLLLAEWYTSLTRLRPDGTTMQTWLWAPRPSIRRGRSMRCSSGSTGCTPSAWIASSRTCRTRFCAAMHAGWPVDRRPSAHALASRYARSR
jgi:hypothetical protein